MVLRIAKIPHEDCAKRGVGIGTAAPESSKFIANSFLGARKAIFDLSRADL